MSGAFAAVREHDAKAWLLLLVVVGLIVAAGFAFWRGLMGVGVALAVLGVVAAVLLL